jgi:hypothetical protein
VKVISGCKNLMQLDVDFTLSQQAIQKILTNLTNLKHFTVSVHEISLELISNLQAFGGSLKSFVCDGTKLEDDLSVEMVKERLEGCFCDHIGDNVHLKLERKAD